MIFSALAIISSFFFRKRAEFSYIFGFAAALVLPNADKSLLEIMAIVAVVSSLPFFFVACDWKKVTLLNKSIIHSCLLQFVSVFIIALPASFLIKDGDVLGGMAVALYTGGTMNANAIAKIFKLENELIVFSNLSDMAFGGLFFIFLLFAAKPFLDGILGKNEKVFEEFEIKTKYSNIGQFLCSIFNFSIAALVDINKLKEIPITVFVFFGAVTVGSFFIHVQLCRIFKINSDVMLVTSVSGIYGPAFIPSICRTIKAPDLLASGLLTGSIGYALGTVLGLCFTLFVRMF